ncbi:dienelactone hydrolase family protein [Dietzia sp. B32]|uniref:dienelactone hydrolase family protein n=1 Tax=Dietzia sp. B32 TaxID=2915130 RepID=UPI0021ADEFC9|nr:dienelactone hydrolase family protein [Dietzia sp. B32]UVE94941.1 dienelactone hydrolase family protein [Dietzia sp. B32]
MAKKTKELLDRVIRRGPYGVDRGDLGFTGTPGSVFVPRGAPSPAPLVGWAHDWTRGPDHYVDTLKHLASWGFVVVAPAADRGLRPHHQHFADHLSAAVEDVLQAHLGRGAVRADPHRIALAGHGLGAGVAALLASQRTDIDAVAMVFPTDTVPSAADRAMTIDASALLLSAAGGVHSEDARDLQRLWRGDLVHRRLEKAIETGLVERNALIERIGLADPDQRTHRAVRPLLAGYLLAALTDDDSYAAFADPEAEFKGTVTVTHEMLDEEADDVLASTPPLLKLVKSFTGG